MTKFFTNLLVLLFAICTYAAADESKFIQFDGERLVSGRSLWIENCKGCHAFGTAGAPIPMSADDWEVRLRKDRATLYDHAINGFLGPDYTMMPERGGNPALSNEQVKMAVDYMLALATYYIGQRTRQVK